MKKYILFTFILVQFCFAFRVCAFEEKTEQISCDSAILLFQKKNPQILNANIEYEIAKNNIKIAHALQNPKFVSDFFIGNVAKGNSNQLGLLFPIEVAKRKLRKNIAEDKADIQLLTLQKTFALEIEKLYFIYLSLCLDKEKLKIENDYLIFLNSKEYENPAYKDFIISKLKNNILQLEEDINAKRKTFNLMINRQNSYIIYDTIDFDIYNFEESNFIKDNQNQIIETETKILDKEIEAAYKNIQLTKNERIPDLVAGGGFAFEYGNKPYAADYSGAFISIDLEVPLFNFITPNINNSILRYEQAKLKKEAFLENSKNTYELKEIQLKKHKRNLNFSKENLHKFLNSHDPEIIYNVKSDYLNSLFNLMNFYFNSE